MFFVLCGAEYSIKFQFSSSSNAVRILSILAGCSWRYQDIYIYSAVPAPTRFYLVFILTHCNEGKESSTYDDSWCQIQDPYRVLRVSYSRLDNELGVLCLQDQFTPDKSNPRGRMDAKTFMDLWFIITIRSNHRSGSSSVGTSCFTRPKGVTTLYWSTNIANSTPCRMWGVSHSWLNNRPGVHIHLCLYLKSLLFIEFISYMLFFFPLIRS